MKSGFASIFSARPLYFRRIRTHGFNANPDYAYQPLVEYPEIDMCQTPTSTLHFLLPRSLPPPHHIVRILSSAGKLRPCDTRKTRSDTAGSCPSPRESTFWQPPTPPLEMMVPIILAPRQVLKLHRRPRGESHCHLTKCRFDGLMPDLPLPFFTFPDAPIANPRGTFYQFSFGHESPDFYSPSLAYTEIWDASGSSSKRTSEPPQAFDSLTRSAPYYRMHTPQNRLVVSRYAPSILSPD